MRRGFGNWGPRGRQAGAVLRSSSPLRPVCLPLRVSNHSVRCETWTRGIKKKATMKIADLPQGTLPAKPVDAIAISEGPAYPTVMQQARNNMQKFSQCVVLTRVGNFYEVSSVCICLLALSSLNHTSCTLIKLRNTPLC
jgi:hypothetical protein